MELRHIRYFLAVAEDQNFTRAAARIGIGQPPLSQQIRDLEEELGAPLFHRVPHGAELTEAGRAFLVEARATLAAAERAKLAAQRAHRGDTGSLALGLTGASTFNAVVAGTIRAFRRTWPGVLLSLEEHNTKRLVERLARGELDAAFLRPGAAEMEGLSLRRFPDEPMVIALPAGHPLAAQERMPLAALAGEPFILYPFPRIIGSSLYDEVVAACRACGFEPVAGQEAPQITSVVNLVAAELGVSVVPASIAQVQLEGVVYRQIEGHAPVARLALATPRRGVSPVTRNLLSLVGGAS